MEGIHLNDEKVKQLTLNVYAMWPFQDDNQQNVVA